MMPESSNPSDHGLRPAITCPHCWHHFPPARMHFLATSPELLYDHRLGPGHARRFLPSRFLANGNAVDPDGRPCHETACPNCHLKIPRDLIRSENLLCSIFGSPSSGKTYLLASMTHQLRHTLATDFGISFDDADREANGLLHDYESRLFRSAEPDASVEMAKTDMVGDQWYDSVFFGQQRRLLPKPFLFDVIPVAGHPGARRANQLRRMLCLYDNAGESFEPGRETEDNPVTRHMARAGCLFFVFDPTQEPRFRDACRGRSRDPQLSDQRLSRQNVLVGEALSRVLLHQGRSEGERIATPLVVILQKFDGWWPLVGAERLENPWQRIQNAPIAGLNMAVIEQVSTACRELLARFVPTVTTTIERYCPGNKVLYVPVSATGCPPIGRTPAGRYFHRAGDIRPMWVEVPFLAMLAQQVPGLVPRLTFSKQEAVDGE